MSTRVKGKTWEAARRKAQRSLAAISDAEDSAIRKAAAADPDNPPLDERILRRTRPATKVAPELVRRSRRP
jgi:hypothetical protein